MKITVEIDCTPAEARQFLGLPDVAPLQAAVLDGLKDKMVAEVDKFAPEALMKAWTSLAPFPPEKVQELFVTMLARGFGPAKE